MSVTAKEVVDFWRDAGPERWFAKDETFDDMCEMAFGDASDDAVAGGMQGWESDAEGALALVILLDQIPRNTHRDSAKAYAGDERARRVADAAIQNGFDVQVAPELQRFFYIPFMHSESLDDQKRSVELNGASGDADSAKWAQHHHDIIERFGRFPHRNALLGRDSTAEEKAYLAEGGFGS